MTYEQYRQLRTYSWYDGIYLAILWTASFACLIGISVYEPLSLACNLIAIATPFFVGFQLHKFRDDGLGGHISFRRALLYCMRVFLNAAILFSIVQWGYMQFLDNGHLASMFVNVMSQPEYAEAMRLYGVNPQEIAASFEEITPTQFALAYFLMNTFAGAVLGLIIAAVMKKD